VLSRYKFKQLAREESLSTIFFNFILASLNLVRTLYPTFRS
jgi:hypothetical protein